MHQCCLRGEPAAIKADLQKIFSTDTIVTAGLEESEVNWDFENPVPFAKESFDIVYSQAMLEHLLKPFEHLMDLTTLVKPGGYLAIACASFLFPYHRTPIHAFNIMPDMIEVVAERAGMVVVKKRYHVGNLCYLLKKTDQVGRERIALLK